MGHAPKPLLFTLFNFSFPIRNVQVCLLCLSWPPGKPNEKPLHHCPSAVKTRTISQKQIFPPNEGKLVIERTRGEGTRAA